MVFVIETITNKVLHRIDAWMYDAEEEACKWAREHGYTSLGREITQMGNMFIWVEKED